MGIDPDDFLKLVMCPTCNNIYSYEKGREVVRGKYITFRCFFIYSPITGKTFICSDTKFMT